MEEIVRGHIGYDGLVMTDDLSMQALSGSFRERTEAAFAAGRRRQHGKPGGFVDEHGLLQRCDPGRRIDQPDFRMRAKRTGQLGVTQVAVH